MGQHKPTRNSSGTKAGVIPGYRCHIYSGEPCSFPPLCFRITTPLPILCHLQRCSICFCGKHLRALATRRPLDSFSPPPLCSPPLRTRLPSDPCLSAADRV